MIDWKAPGFCCIRSRSKILPGCMLVARWYPSSGLLPVLCCFRLVIDLSDCRNLIDLDKVSVNLCFSSEFKS